MKSFDTELLNPVVQKEIVDLGRKIHLYQTGEIDEDKFRSIRLARGIYGQRQFGVQMVRIKLPFGKVTTKQLLRISDISDEYSNGWLHLTTRQDIQIHYVSLDKTPELWEKLAHDDITIREACGNTVRNVTASASAGIDPDEPFDVSPYAHETFKYFLRNPICQELGRKFKITFSSSDSDSAFTFMNDIGFIPKLKNENGIEQRGFKVVVGGGLGAVPNAAQTAYEFLHEDLIIPFIESILRVFDRLGERNNRNKARLKHLLNKIGLTELLKQAEQERAALKSKTYKINRYAIDEPSIPQITEIPSVLIENNAAYEIWLKTNVFPQKQKGYYAASVKVQLGNLTTADARKLAGIVKKYAADDIRITINQGFILKYIRIELLPVIYNELLKINLADPGFDTTADITACPGTDTCNLGISNSTAVSVEFERVIKEEFPDLIFNRDIKIKISGCMNSCGQHGLANIGFHGSSLKHNGKVLPALQLLLGGGGIGNGSGRFAERVIKIPSKRAVDALRTILKDYQSNSLNEEKFNDYYDRTGKNYFYRLLLPLADLSGTVQEDYIDWGSDQAYTTEVGVGECAGVIIDLVATLLFDSEEKLNFSKENLSAGKYADSIYHAYSSFINSAKALLLLKDLTCNTQIGIINDFDQHYTSAGIFSFPVDFKTTVLQINKNEPAKEFAEEYLKQAEKFFTAAKAYRESRVDEKLNEEVVDEK